jgi:hypothetical protein
MEPGKTLLTRGLGLIAVHPAVTAGSLTSAFPFAL